MAIRVLLLWLLASLVWAALFIAGTLEGWWRRPLAAHGDAHAFANAAIALIDETYKGNAAFVLLERGRPVATHFVSVGRPVDGDTRFQVASLSKWITAWGVMTLVDAGKLELDAAVSRYLTRWKLPVGKFNNDQVTIRRLLSHTAGLTDGLGYAGFEPGQRVQSLEASLTRAADASPGASGVVEVGVEPGTTFKYSGGGYTLLQLLVEEVTGQSFEDYMRAAVFEPLGMTRSTFVLEDGASNVAELYDRSGSPATHYRYTALGAASLYTSSSDLTRLLAAHGSSAGAPAGRGVVRVETLKLMRAPHAAQLGADIWGLGTILYAPNQTGDFIIGHDGKNTPAINTAARLDPSTGDGIIALETGNPMLATRLAGEWVFWRTRNVDTLTIADELSATLKGVVVGLLAIALIGLVLAYRGWKSRKPTQSRAQNVCR